jgi:hypothetical protein
VTLRDLCDVVYVMQVGELERQIIPLAAAVIASGNGTAETAGLIAEARASFDAELVSDPKPENVLVALRRELGVA